MRMASAPNAVVSVHNMLTKEQVLTLLPPWLREGLGTLRQHHGGNLYLSGGSLRDLLLGRQPHDVDLTIAAGAVALAQALAQQTGGTFVLLDATEDVARVVHGGLEVDISSFREGTSNIEADLQLRDFTINALALSLEGLLEGEVIDMEEPLACLDPTGGLTDLRQGVIRMTQAAVFTSDPLRMLRAYRLAAVLGYTLAEATQGAIVRQRQLISRSAPERVAAELNTIMSSPRAHTAVAAMAKSGLLFEIIPELAAGAQVEQPKSHHLDVLAHNLETLRQSELLLARPELGFPQCSAAMRAYLAKASNILVLKWAALLHDLGKPATWSQDVAQDGRITFHQHERVGVELVQALAQRLHWSGRQTERVCLLIGQHMRPFHLLNVARQGELSLKACIRLVRALGKELPGLLVLAMADARAGKGEERPEAMEEELAQLVMRLEEVQTEHVLPVQNSPPLLDGRDLIGQLGLEPGPVFKQILTAVEMARMEGMIATRAEALHLARSMVLAK